MKKNEFLNKIDKLGLSKESFCEITGVSINTVNNWNDNDRKLPEWIDSWLENYEEKEKFVKLKSLIMDTK